MQSRSHHAPRPEQSGRQGPGGGERTAHGRRLAAAIVVILAAAGWWTLRDRQKDKLAPDQAVPVSTAAAHEGTLVTYVSQPGAVKPSNSVVVRSRVDGQITRIAFTGGQIVKKGDLLAEIDARPYQSLLQQAAGDLARSQAQLDNAKDVLQRYQILLKQDSITPRRVADQESLVREYAAAVKANQARLDASGLQVSYTRITAPISGTVGLRRVDPGNMVSAADPNGIAVVTQSQPSTVTFSIPVASAARVLGWLRKGDCIPVDAYVDGPQDVIGTGFLRAANNQADPATGTVKLEAEFANSEGALLPNQFVTVRMPDRVLRQATLVPTAAIQQGAAGAFVYVVKDDSTAAVTPVKVGPGDASTTAIESGLAPGAQVVIEGADRLRAGTPVKVTAQAQPPSAYSLPQCRRDASGAASHAAHANTPGAKAERQPDSAARS